MDGIKLSVLQEKKTRIAGNRKSKGKFSFVQKIKYFYLMLKYAYYGVDKFSDAQLDELINLLNIKEITYKQTVEDFEKDKAEIDKDLATMYESIGTMDSQEYKDLDGDQQLLNATSNAIDAKKAVDEKIANVNGTLNSINSIKESAQDALEARQINREVASQELKEEVELIKNNLNEEQPVEVQEEVVEEEPEMKEELDTSLIETMSEEEINDLRDKIISNTVEQEPIKEEVKDEIREEIEASTAAPFEVQYPTTDPLVTEKSTNVSNDSYEEITTQFNDALNAEYQKYSSTVNESIANLTNLINSSFSIYVRNIKDMIDGYVAKVQEEDRRIAQEIIDGKDNEIRAEQNKNAELSKTNDKLTTDLSNANNTIATRDKTIEDLNATIVQKNNEITDEKDQNAKLTQANNNLETEKENLIKENESKDAKIRELEAALAERNKDVADRDEEIAKRDQEIVGLNNKVDEVQRAKQAAEEAAAKRAEAIKAVLFSASETKTEDSKTI